MGSPARGGGGSVQVLGGAEGGEAGEGGKGAAGDAVVSSMQKV